MTDKNYSTNVQGHMTRRQSSVVDGSSVGVVSSVIDDCLLSIDVSSVDVDWVCCDMLILS